MKKKVATLVTGILALALSGCMFTTPEASLYRLPKLAGEYESLETQIDALLSTGGEYAAPTSGSNLQSVQMIDLDGDGVEEAVEEKLGEKVWRVEGKQTGLWVAMDYMDVVVHIFTTELRSFYKLEELWADAPLKRYDYEE